MTNIFKRWYADERGQDLLEYALLTATLGFLAVAGVAALNSAMSSSYQSWDTAGQSDALVEVPPPQ